MRLRASSQHEMSPFKRTAFIALLLVADVALGLVEAVARLARARSRR